MTEKHKYDLERWKLLIADRQQSTLPFREWCEMNGVTKDAYYYWLKQVRTEALAEALNQLQLSQFSGGFVDVTPDLKEVPVMHEEIMSQPSAIIRRNDIEVEIFGSASPNLVKVLIESVKNA